MKPESLTKDLQIGFSNETSHCHHSICERGHSTTYFLVDSSEFEFLEASTSSTQLFPVNQLHRDSLGD